MRHGKRVDKNQQAMLEVLKRVNVAVEVIGKPLDLLVNPRFFCPHCAKEIDGGRTSLMEIKNPDRCSSEPDSRLTKDQIEFIARWPGKIDVVRTEEDVLRAVLGEALK